MSQTSTPLRKITPQRNFRRKSWRPSLAGKDVSIKLSVMQSEYGDRLRVAPMAAIAKPDGGFRPLHDGRVNNEIIYRDRIQCPGPPEVAAVVRECSESREAPFAVAADIKSAHRFVKIRSQD